MPELARPRLAEYSTPHRAAKSQTISLLAVRADVFPPEGSLPCISTATLHSRWCGDYWIWACLRALRLCSLCKEARLPLQLVAVRGSVAGTLCLPKTLSGLDSVRLEAV